ncbi:peptide/nickel transport system ATP-binding protein [Microbacterium sp. W4I4]|uniref:ATP-binding cassette domain-containing protein n=1 Tax=Microbacterium sp. W4I4 TaxID=3042295 RepID=UPI002781C826|nr:ABC transporter ATP-binding protein [Microbacterium sp. W4I4]MDQ0612557.1 peptide/nickel transport system ATP-binding protein [Microbacterium sp. W4I4]
MTAVDVQELRVEIAGRAVVDGVSFTVAPGECVAIVGESGAGKSLTARALLGLLPERAVVSASRLEIDGADAARLSELGWRRLRGRSIALVSQDALAALDPLRRIGREVAEPMEIHGLHPGGRDDRVQELLTSVSMPDPVRTVQSRPHELSGGMRQRALIASALAGEPAVLVADEATTALDATVQARILDLLRSIADAGTAVVFISHDFAAVRRVADRVLVMRDGVIVEQGAVDEVMRAPRSEYTRALVAASTADLRAPREGGAVPLLQARGLSVAFDRPAVVGASFTLSSGRTLGVVGESGSGKTTLARMLVGVQHPDAGELTWSSPQRVQLVHQNPLGAFDPRWTIARSLTEALQAAGVPREERPSRVIGLLAEVGLAPELAGRRARELSGGQRQRAAIARALAADPTVLVLDEPVSALDPTVRGQVLALLDRLQQERELTMVFVSHDLAVIAAVCDDVLVMQDGVIVEQGPVADVFAAPRHPFTRELLAAAGADQ